MNLDKFRKLQMIVSSVFFISVFIFFFFTSKFRFTDIQLSYWGVKNGFAWLWNYTLVILSLSIFFNSTHYILNQPRFRYQKFLVISFLCVSLFLCLTGLAPMDNEMHTFVAWAYFFTYPLAIFLLAHLNSKNLLYKQWVNHLIFSASLIFFPALFFKIGGMAVPETIHTLIVLLWNLYILKK